MQNIFFTSDSHAGHSNIVRGTSNWEDKSGCRDFNTVEEHDETLALNINALVKPNDILYHLGDWSFGGIEKVGEFRNRLNCKNIHYILGNHSQHIRPTNSPLRGYFSSVQEYLELSLKIDSMKSGRYGKTKIVLFHYPLQVWNNHHHGSIMLHGHCHGSLPVSTRKIMDVGLDTNNLYPYHLDEIIEIMKGRSVDFIDHHNESTN